MYVLSYAADNMWRTHIFHSPITVISQYYIRNYYDTSQITAVAKICSIICYYTYIQDRKRKTSHNSTILWSILMNIFKSRYIKKKFQPQKMGKMKFFHTAFGGLMKTPQTLLAFNTAICLSKSLLLIYINLMVKLAMLFVYYFLQM